MDTGTNRRWRQALGILTVLVIQGASSQALFAQSELERLITEGPRHWRQMEGVYCGLGGTMIIEAERKGQAPGGTRLTREFLLSGRWVRVAETTDGKSNVLGFNSRYAFELDRAAPDAPYVSAFQGANSSLFEGRLRGKLDDYLNCTWSLGSRTLPAWMEVKEFAFLSATREASGNKSLVRAKARYSPPGPVKFPAPRPFEAEMLLDPERHWCLLEAKLTISMTTSQGTQKQFGFNRRIEFGQPISGVPVPSQVTIERWSDDGASLVEKVLFKDLTFRQATEQEFSLSAFGLPEPPGIEWARRTPWWLWLIGSAFALLLVAAGFMWLKRRAMRSASLTIER